MRTKRIRRPRSFWEAIVHEYRASRLSARDFAARKGLSLASLQRWVKRLEPGDDRFVEVEAIATAGSPGPVQVVVGAVRVELTELPPVEYVTALVQQTAAP